MDQRASCSLPKTLPQKDALGKLQAIFDALLKTLDKDISKSSDDDLQKYNEELKKALDDCKGKLKDWIEKKP